MADLTLQIKNLSAAISRADWQSVLSVLKIVSIVVSLVCVFILIYILKKKGELAKPKTESIPENSHEIVQPNPAIAAYDKHWLEIKNKAYSYNESDWKVAVIEADRFIDDVLKNAGFPGETMGERLMLIKPDQLLSLQYLWDAHKLRNLLVHDSSFRLTHNQAVAAVESFEQALRELGAIS